MKTIYKYILEEKEMQKVIMPKDAQLLCVQTQNDKVCLWAFVDTDNEEAARFIEIYGTGHEIPKSNERVYIGTFQLHNGSLVFHVFELLPKHSHPLK